MKRRDVLIGGGALAAAAVGATVIVVDHMGSAADYDAAIAATRAPLPEQAATRDLIRSATLAPNGHNTQPWLFRASGSKRIVRSHPPAAIDPRGL